MASPQNVTAPLLRYGNLRGSIVAFILAQQPVHFMFCSQLHPEPAEDEIFLDTAGYNSTCFPHNMHVLNLVICPLELRYISGVRPPSTAGDPSGGKYRYRLCTPLALKQKNDCVLSPLPQRFTSFWVWTNLNAFRIRSSRQ